MDCVVYRVTATICGATARAKFALYLWDPYRLVFVPDHDPIPRLEDGGVDRSLITRIVIMEVVEYHGDWTACLAVGLGCR